MQPQLNVVDSSGWIEYFLGTDRAEHFTEALTDVSELIVPVIAIYEVNKRITQLISASAAQRCVQVMQKGRSMQVTESRAIAASIISIKHQLGMADALMYGIAIEFDAQFWTQDIDYQGLNNVRYFAKPSN